jgi:hypothetical protein
VSCPAERQQLGQQRRDLAEWREGRMPGCNIGELGCDTIATEVERGDARAVCSICHR